MSHKLPAWELQTFSSLVSLCGESASSALRSQHHHSHSVASTGSESKYPASACHYKPGDWLGSSLQLRQPLKSRHISGLASNSGQIQSCIWLQQMGMANLHELRKYFFPLHWLWTTLLACAALASAHRLWVFLNTGLHVVLANIHIYSSGPEGAQI